MSTAEATLPAVVIEPQTAPAEASVIWLHGLGADGHDFEPIVPQLGLPPGLGVRFVFPHAPERPVTVNGGMAMRAWYDVQDMELSREDEAGTRESERQVQALIEAEQARGVAPGRIVLAGFSQGGAIALHTALRYPQRLAGLLALSTYLPLADTVEAERSAANAMTPVFMAHGLDDPIIPIARGRESFRRLQELGQPAEWHEYAMPHAVCAEEIGDIGRWLTARLAR